MTNLSANARGVLFMLAAMASFTLNDSLLKLVIEEVTPYLGVAVRGLFATAFSLALVFGLRQKLPVRDLVQKNVVWRNLADLSAIMFFSIGIAFASLPAVTALSMLAPVLVVIAAGLFLKAEIGMVQWGLILLSLLGALMVAQPGGGDYNIYALTGFANAVFVAARDLLGRLVPGRISGMTVVVSGNIIVTLGAFVGVIVVDGGVALSFTQLALLAGAGVLLTLAHFFIFLSFRVGDAVVVAPYVYMAAVFAMIYSALIFGVFPNTIALVGIALIVVAGVVFVLVNEQ